MSRIRLVKHAPGAPGLRLLGLGPRFLPSRGILKLKQLLDKHAFWAKGRTKKQIRLSLASSTVVISLWRGNRMVGFGRATSDGIYRAVLWDIVVAGDLQGLGLGRDVIEALVSSKALKDVERIYLMTTNSAEFYLQLGFQECHSQNLLVIRNEQA
ncbi:GNAT family N-acetyltransferase [Prochlorococcus sp. MIT 1307]|uniref:GNAT family N-acetyltransferase n=1 Tax=Prochlorococcus sp. MIT 1307 TaxID=3096219 RepID=UPI002A74A14C|nr:GNAT family N-acetyltransferase [Prochlorococcus sp. MIT 1307]